MNLASSGSSLVKNPYRGASSTCFSSSCSSCSASSTVSKPKSIGGISMGGGSGGPAAAVAASSSSSSNSSSSAASASSLASRCAAVSGSDSLRINYMRKMQYYSYLPPTSISTLMSIGVNTGGISCSSWKSSAASASAIASSLIFQRFTSIGCNSVISYIGLAVLPICLSSLVINFISTGTLVPKYILTALPPVTNSQVGSLLRKKRLNAPAAAASSVSDWAAPGGLVTSNSLDGCWTILLVADVCAAGPASIPPAALSDSCMAELGECLRSSFFVLPKSSPGISNIDSAAVPSISSSSSSASSSSTISPIPDGSVMRLFNLAKLSSSGSSNNSSQSVANPDH
uniref:Uncharacterized protein n=1 Tax=Glossina pallidipes TaxID=7398 RepID=A0A1A9ZRX9_GLOPL